MRGILVGRSAQAILIGVLVVLLGLVVGLPISAVRLITNPAGASSELRLVPIGYLVLGVLIVGVLRTLRDR